MQNVSDSEVRSMHLKGTHLQKYVRPSKWRGVQNSATVRGLSQMVHFQVFSSLKLVRILMLR